MKFTVTDLRLLTKMLQSANTEEEIQLSKRLKDKQPGFYAIPICYEPIPEPIILHMEKNVAPFIALSLARFRKVL